MLRNEYGEGITVQLNENTIRVKKETFIHNTNDNKYILKGFEGEFLNKQIMKFSISAILKEKDLIRDSNYFDESHDGL